MVQHINGKTWDVHIISKTNLFTQFVSEGIPTKDSIFLLALTQTRYADSGVPIILGAMDAHMAVGSLHWLTLRCQNRSTLDQAVTVTGQDGISPWTVGILHIIVEEECLPCVWLHQTITSTNRMWQALMLKSMHRCSSKVELVQRSSALIVMATSGKDYKTE